MTLLTTLLGWSNGLPEPVASFKLAQHERGRRVGDEGGELRADARYTSLAPGEEFSVCVTVTVRIPFLPEFVDANTATGQFVVERDRYVDG